MTTGYAEMVRAILIVSELSRVPPGQQTGDMWVKFVWALHKLSDLPESEIWAMQECEFNALLKRVVAKFEALAILKNAVVAEESDGKAD